MSRNSKNTNFRKAERRMQRAEKLASRGVLVLRDFHRAERGFVKAFHRTVTFKG